MGSELWFREFERILNELEEAGVPPDVAYERASAMVDGALREKLADAADRERKIRKGE